MSNLVLSDRVELTAEHRDDLFNGVTVIKGKAMALFSGRKESEVRKEEQDFMTIPYYAWAHRGQGEMAVWLPREESLARPLPGATIASTSKTSVSGGKEGTTLNDQWEPKNSNDYSHPYLHWWPNKGTQEWVQYDFTEPETVSSVEVYWFDDTGRGECRIPESWRVLYKAGNEWKPVTKVEPYSVEKDKYNKVNFKPVRTSALRLEIQLEKDFSAGILEWKVK